MTDWLGKLNGEVRAAKQGVVIRQRGDRLYLQATLPPKPGSHRQKPYQQERALKIYANPARFQEARREAIKVGAARAYRSLSWEPYLGVPGPHGSVAEWIQKFEQDYFQRRARTPQTETSYNDDKKAFALLCSDRPLTPETIRKAAISTLPDSRQRKRTCIALAALAKFAGIEVELKSLEGRYSPYTATTERELPSDEAIAHAYKSIPNSQWRRAFSLIAT